MKNCTCGGETVVTETREIDGKYRRRRKCVDCGEAYFTLETYLSPAYKTSGEVHKKRRVEVKTKENYKNQIANIWFAKRLVSTIIPENIFASFLINIINAQ